MSVACCILVCDEFVLQSLVLCTDAFDLADDLGRVVEAAVRPGEQREMQCMARIVERDGALPDSFLRERHRGAVAERRAFDRVRSEEHTSELQSLMRISYAVFCLTKKKKSRLNP